MAHYKTSATVGVGVVQHIIQADSEEDARNRMSAAYPNLKKINSIEELHGRHKENGVWKTRMVS